MPHYAEAREKGTGLTYQEVLRGLGFNTRIVPRLGLEEGIAAAKMLFGQCWFDESRCEAGIRALTHYKRDWKERQG